MVQLQASTTSQPVIAHLSLYASSITSLNTGFTLLITNNSLIKTPSHWLQKEFFSYYHTKQLVGTLANCSLL